MHKKVSFFISFLFLQALYADTIILKNGTRIQGKITNQSTTKIEINVNGQTRIIDKNDISRIEFEIPEELKKQEQLKRQQEERKKQEELERQQEEELKKQEEERKKLSTDDIKFVYLRSLVFPGWGHYRINKKNQSYLWGGLFWGFLIATGIQTNKTISLQKEYDNFSRTQFILGNLDLIPDELSFYFSSQASNKTLAVKNGIKQTQNLGLVTIIVYLTQFYFLNRDISTLTSREQYFQSDSQIVENLQYQKNISKNHLISNSFPIWSYSTNF